jgi:phosphoglycerol transferase MdoB-like AlkP superfamily enzyme
MNPLNPRGFLLVGGIVLVLVAVLGYMGLIGPTPEQSLFGSLWYFTDLENLAHLVFGIVALAAYYLLKDENLTKWLVILVGVVAALAVVLGFLAGTDSPNVSLMGIPGNLENPMDTVLHIVVAVWAFYAGLVGSKSKA